MIDTEYVMITRCECLICGERWEFVKERVSEFVDVACCGTVRVSQDPWQATFTDAGGSWCRSR